MPTARYDQVADFYQSGWRDHLSRVLLDRARTMEAIALHVTYVHGDAASPSILEGQIFDAVVCSFRLSAINDLDGAIATVAQVLTPVGQFVFTHALVADETYLDPGLHPAATTTRAGG